MGKKKKKPKTVEESRSDYDTGSSRSKDAVNDQPATSPIEKSIGAIPMSWIKEPESPNLIHSLDSSDGDWQSIASLDDFQTVLPRRSRRQEYDISPSPENISKTILPLKDEFDFQLACNTCFRKANEEATSFILSSKSHTCNHDVLIVRKKNEVAASWLKIRHISKAINHTGRFRICAQFAERKPCKVPEQLCTFPHNPPELELWTMVRDKTFSLDEFVKNCHICKIFQGTSRPQDATKDQHTILKENTSTGAIPKTLTKDHNTNTKTVQTFQSLPVPGICPSCHQQYNMKEKRKLTEQCGHERCLSCISKNTGFCPLCQNDCDNSQQRACVKEPLASNVTVPSTQANDPEQSENSSLQESVNFYRIITLIVDLGTDVLCKTFYFYKPKNEVKEYFVTLRSKIEDMKEKDILTKPQYNKLVVPDPNPDEYDISLLITLLRNVFLNDSPPSNGWNQNPADDDVSLSADILRLRNIRNGVVAHKSKAQLNETDFNNLWLQITKLLKRIAHFMNEKERSSMEKKMNELKQKILDVTDREKRFLKTLKAWFEEDRNKILEQLENLQLKVGDPAQNSDMQSLMQELESVSQTIVNCIENCTFGGFNRQQEETKIIKTKLEDLLHDNGSIKVQLEALQRHVRTTGNSNPLSKGFFDEQCQSQDTSKWEQKQAFLKSVGKFKKGHYILISSKIEGIEKIRHLESLACIPWIAVFDFDPNSKLSGLLSCLREKISQKRSLRECTINEIPKSITDTCTSWVYMKGCSELPETLNSRKQEETKFLTMFIGELEKFGAVTSPKFTILVFWPTDVNLSLEFQDLILLINRYLINVSIMLVDEGDFRSSHLTSMQERSNVSKTEIRVAEICKLIHSQLVSESSLNRSSHKLPTEDLSNKSGITNDEAMWLRQYLDVLYIDNQTGKEHTVDELQEIEKDFYKGASLPWSWWYAARAGFADIERDIMKNIVSYIQHNHIDVGQAGIVTLYHAPGSGGTCLAQRILWEFKNRIPCAQIKKCIGCTDDIDECIDILHRCTKMPLLLLVDGEDAQYVKTLRNLLQRKSVIFLDVKRCHDKIEQVDQMSKKGVFYLQDIVTSRESRQIMLRYKKHCNDQQFQRVTELNDDIEQDTRHSIFDFGLAVHNFQYKGIPSYVKAHLDLDKDMKSKLKPWQRALAYLSLVYYYGQSAVPCYFLKDILERDDVIDMHDLPTEMHSLIVDDANNEKSCIVRISHQCVALAIINQTLDRDSNDHAQSNTLSLMAKQNLGQFAVEFIQAMERIGNGYAICEIMKRTFISRDNIVIGDERETQYKYSKKPKKPKFTPLLEDASHQSPFTERFDILIALTESFPRNAHFRAHLGRLYCLCKSHEEESAEKCFEQAVKIALDEVSGISTECYPYIIRCDLNRIYHMYGIMFASRIKKYVDQLRSNKPSKLDIRLKAKELLPTVKKACYYFVKCREMLPMGHEENFGYIAEIQVRLNFCVIVDEAEGNLISWTESLKNDDVSEFVSDCFVKLDDLILECFTVTEAEDRDRKDILRCLETFFKLFHSPAGRRENDSFGDIQKRRREIAKIRLKHCKKGKYGVTQYVINSADISFIVKAYEQNFDEYKAKAGLVSKGAMNRDYKEWLCAIRQSTFANNYTIENVLVIVENWVKQLDTTDAKFYRFILKSMLGFGNEDHPGDTKLLELAQIEKNSLKLSKDVIRPNFPREWLGRCSDSKFIRRLKWRTRFFGQIEGKQSSHEDTSKKDLEIMTGTIKPPNDKKLEGFISLDLGPHNIIPVEVFFIPLKTKCQGKRNAHCKVQFYLGFSIAHGYEAYEVEEIRNVNCEKCTYQVPIRKGYTQVQCPRCKIKINVPYSE